MTDKPHTPTDDSSGTLHKDFVRDLFEMGAVYFEYVKTGIDAEPHFNRWYEAEIADAEHRGAVRALRDAADEVRAEILWQYKENINGRADSVDSIDRLLDLERVFSNRANWLEGNE